MPAVACVRLDDEQRTRHTAALFDGHFPLRLEPTIFRLAGRLSSDYRGGYWEFFALSNGGFYMAPDPNAMFRVARENGFDGLMSADAFGLCACLDAYSRLSFGAPAALAETCARQYHLLRDLVFEHPEAVALRGAAD